MLGLLGLPGVSASALAAPWLLVIDPGHGGAHDGAVGPDGAKEKDLALQISRQVATLAEAQLPVNALLTREGDRDVQLEDRVAFANRKRANLFVSIHLNSMPTDESRRLVKGIERRAFSVFPKGICMAPSRICSHSGSTLRFAARRSSCIAAMPEIRSSARAKMAFWPAPLRARSIGT